MSIRPASPTKVDDARLRNTGTLNITAPSLPNNVLNRVMNDRNRRDSIVDIVEVVKQQDHARGELLAKSTYSICL